MEYKDVDLLYAGQDKLVEGGDRVVRETAASKELAFKRQCATARRKRLASKLSQC